jgi:hypothetical protein
MANLKARAGGDDAPAEVDERGAASVVEGRGVIV